jgi:hypothetical protein
MEAPEQPNVYEGKQVLINSDRLVFNAKADSILIYSNKHIAFSSNGNIHFDTGDEGNFVMNSKNISLGLEGDKNLPPEPAVLGNQMEKTMIEMCEMLEGMIYTLEFSYPPYCLAPPVGPNVPGGATPFVEVKNKLNTIKKNLPLFKSSRVNLPTDNMYGESPGGSYDRGE